MWIDNLNYQIWDMIENGVSPVLLLAIVKSLIRFEREMVIKFTNNTVVLDMEHDQFFSMGWIGWAWEIKQMITSVRCANPN